MIPRTMKTTFLMKNAFRSKMIILLAVAVMAGRSMAADSDFESLKAAADRNDARAAFEVAERYEEGKDVAQDPTKAAEYARRSAEQGNADGEVLYGSYLGRGIGVSTDRAEAAKWYEKAANQGDALAQFSIGSFYENGRGVPTNHNLAMEWWQKAAGLNLADAQNALGQAFFDTGSTNLASYPDAAKWLRKAADQDFTASMNNLGVLYEHGWGTNQDWNEAAKWYRKAALAGNSKAQGNLGVLYLDGRGVTNDLVQAYVWFKLCAAGGGGVGKKYMIDYDEKNLLTTNQLIQADQMFNDLNTRITMNKIGPVKP